MSERTYLDTLNEMLKDPEFKKEWDELEPERQVTKAIANARSKSKVTQMELSQKTGINQSNLSRIERGTMIPSIKTLSKIAQGMGLHLKIEFVP